MGTLLVFLSDLLETAAMPNTMGSFRLNRLRAEC
jgi:hypothetical protein